VAIDPERRASLLGAKLRALVAAGWADARPAVGALEGTFPGGATMQAGGVGWVLVDGEAHRSLGPAMAWARQHRVDELHLLVERDAGLLTRRAGQFRRPATIWSITGDQVHPAAPDPIPTTVTPPESARAAAEALRQAGLDVVEEHGEITGEVLGLEVARVVTDADGSARIEMGVGRHDREAFAMLHAEREAAEALRSVTETVAAHRRPGAPAHPLNRLAASRWLRARLVAEPGLIGAVEVRPVEGVVPRAGVKDAVPEGAVGLDGSGRPVVAVTSTGIDLDLVPTAADLRLAHSPSARLVLVVPERDAHPVTKALASALLDPADVVALPGDWRGAT
jgi:hypothetical protein